MVLNMDGKSPHIPPLLEAVKMYRDYREMSLGMGNVNGDEWYRMRTNVNQIMMRPAAVTQFLARVNDVTDDFVRRLDSVQARHPSQEVPRLWNEIRKWTMESAAATCFDIRLNGLHTEDKDAFSQKMVDANAASIASSFILRFNVPWYRILPQLSKPWKELVKSEDFFFKNAQKLVDECISNIQAKASAGELKEGEYSFMAYLLGKDGLSYKDVSIITMSLFFDGLQTTSPTVLSQLYCLASNPEKQERLREEVREIAPDPSKPITTEMINRASYLKACIKEGFRFFPVGSEVSRLPQKDIVIGGYQIPAGTYLELNHNMLLTEEEYFTDSQKYIPERWLRGQEEPPHPYLMIPFGYGPRTCVGRRFAEQEINVVMMKILQRFRLEWPHNEPLKQHYNILLTLDGPDSIKFIPTK